MESDAPGTPANSLMVPNQGVRRPHHGVPIATFALTAVVEEHRLAERLDEQREDEISAEALPKLLPEHRQVEERAPEDDECGVEPELVRPLAGRGEVGVRREVEEQRRRRDGRDDLERRLEPGIGEDATIAFGHFLFGALTERSVFLVHPLLEDLQIRRSEMRREPSGRLVLRHHDRLSPSTFWTEWRLRSGRP
jgi:hypothetical protein